MSSVAEQLRAWAQRLCHLTSLSQVDLERVVGPPLMESPPAGISELDIDDREIGLGGIEVAFEPGAISRADLARVFGEGTLLPRLAHHPIRREYRVEQAGGSEPMQPVRRVRRRRQRSANLRREAPRRSRDLPVTKPYPWYYAVNDRPVKLVKLDNGGLDALVFDGATGGCA